MLRPIKVDVDKPEGFIKKKLRRWYRGYIKRLSRQEIVEEQIDRVLTDEMIRHAYLS